MSTFTYYANKYQTRGWLDNADCKAMREACTGGPLEPGDEELLRIFGATDTFACNEIILRSRAWFANADKAKQFAEGAPLGEDGAAFLMELRQMLGAPDAEICKRLGCGRYWSDVANAIEALSAPKQTRRAS